MCERGHERDKDHTAGRERGLERDREMTCVNSCEARLLRFHIGKRILLRVATGAKDSLVKRAAASAFFRAASFELVDSLPNVLVADGRTARFRGTEASERR